MLTWAGQVSVPGVGFVGEVFGGYGIQALWVLCCAGRCWFPVCLFSPLPDFGMLSFFFGPCWDKLVITPCAWGLWHSCRAEGSVSLCSS